MQEDERQIPWYHLSSPAAHDTGLFKYGALLRLYSITVTGETVSIYQALARPSVSSYRDVFVNDIPAPRTYRELSYGIYSFPTSSRSSHLCYMRIVSVIIPNSSELAKHLFRPCYVSGFLPMPAMMLYS